MQTRRLPDSVRALDEAVTVAEVLETLAVWGGREAGRAAVFLVKGNRLRDWRTVGFEEVVQLGVVEATYRDTNLRVRPLTKPHRPLAKPADVIAVLWEYDQLVEAAKEAR